MLFINGCRIDFDREKKKQYENDLGPFRFLTIFFFLLLLLERLLNFAQISFTTDMSFVLSNQLHHCDFFQGDDICLFGSMRYWIFTNQFFFFFFRSLFSH